MLEGDAVFFLIDLVGPDVVAGAKDRDQFRGLAAAQEIVEEQRWIMTELKSSVRVSCVY